MRIREKQPSLSDQALQRLDQADQAESPETAAALRQEAAVFATLAVAKQLEDVRESIDNMKDNLEDQQGFGVGWHMNYVVDSLKDISRRQ